jgi:hypothetical protein
MKVIRGWIADLYFTNLANSCRRVVSFMLRPLCRPRKDPFYQLDRKLGSLLNRSERQGNKQFLPLLGLKSRRPGRIAHIQSHIDRAAIAPNIYM